MSAPRIAPTLVYAHKPTPLRTIMQGKGAIRSYFAADAWRELRALLAVARAARPMLRTRAHYEWAALKRALSRLDSVSRGGRAASARRGDMDGRTR